METNMNSELCNMDIPICKSAQCLNLVHGCEHTQNAYFAVAACPLPSDHGHSFYTFLMLRQAVRSEIFESWQDLRSVGWLADNLQCKTDCTQQSTLLTHGHRQAKRKTQVA